MEMRDRSLGRIRWLIVSTTCLLLVLLAPAVQVEAHPYGGNAGGLHRVSDAVGSQNFRTNIDGFQVRGVAPGEMDVARGDGTPGVIVTSNNNVRGLNVRPIQITAWFPAAQRNVEFVAMGIGVGCIANGQGGSNCSGVSFNGGVTKRVYLDGNACLNACVYGSSWPGPALSAGQATILHMQRRWNGNAFVWRVYTDGTLRTTRLRHLMESGVMNAGIESSTFGAFEFGSPNHQNVNMALDSYTQMWHHNFGDPSANDPTTANMHPVPWTVADNPHAGVCEMQGSADSSGTVILRGLGRC